MEYHGKELKINERKGRERDDDKKKEGFALFMKQTRQTMSGNDRKKTMLSNMRGRGHVLCGMRRRKEQARRTIQLITWLPASGIHLVEMISSVNSVLPTASSWPWLGCNANKHEGEQQEH